MSIRALYYTIYVHGCRYITYVVYRGRSTVRYQNGNRGNRAEDFRFRLWGEIDEKSEIDVCVIPRERELLLT